MSLPSGASARHSQNPESGRSIASPPRSALSSASLTGARHAGRGIAGPDGSRRSERHRSSGAFMPNRRHRPIWPTSRRDRPAAPGAPPRRGSRADRSSPDRPPGRSGSWLGAPGRPDRFGSDGADDGRASRPGHRRAAAGHRPAGRPDPLGRAYGTPSGGSDCRALPTVVPLIRAPWNYHEEADRTTQSLFLYIRNYRRGTGIRPCAPTQEVPLRRDRRRAPSRSKIRPHQRGARSWGQRVHRRRRR